MPMSHKIVLKNMDCRFLGYVKTIYEKSIDFHVIGIDSAANKSKITHVNPNCRVC